MNVVYYFRFETIVFMRFFNSNEAFGKCVYFFGGSKVGVHGVALLMCLIHGNHPSDCGAFVSADRKRLLESKSGYNTENLVWGDKVVLKIDSIGGTGGGGEGIGALRSRQPLSRIWHGEMEEKQTVHKGEGVY